MLILKRAGRLFALMLGLLAMLGGSAHAHDNLRCSLSPSVTGRGRGEGRLLARNEIDLQANC